jgi:hypothetical protein
MELLMEEEVRERGSYVSVAELVVAAGVDLPSTISSIRASVTFSRPNLSRMVRKLDLLEIALRSPQVSR